MNRAKVGASNSLADGPASESPAHLELKRLALIWAQANGYPIVACEVSLPNLRFRLDVGAYRPGSRRVLKRDARLPNGPAVQNLALPDSTRVQWLRGGTAPEIEQVAFELSANGGTSWLPLGAGARIAGGWECSGLSLPANGLLRARGRTVGGASHASSG